MLFSQWSGECNNVLSIRVKLPSHCLGKFSGPVILLCPISCSDSINIAPKTDYTWIRKGREGKTKPTSCKSGVCRTMHSWISKIPQRPLPRYHKGSDMLFLLLSPSYHIFFDFLGASEVSAALIALLLRSWHTFMPRELFGGLYRSLTSYISRLSTDLCYRYGIIFSTVLHYRWPLFRKQTLAGKGFIVSSFTIFGVRLSYHLFL